MIIFALILLGIGLLGGVGIVLYAMKGAIGHNTPEHGLPSRTVMRRYMLMGLYCNPDDPRVFVENPRGNGWTINMRSEQAAAALWIMCAVAMVGAILFTVLMFTSSSS